MAYIGRNPAIGTQKVLDSLESQFDGVLTTFDLRYSTNTIYPTLASALIVSLGGVLQEPGSAYDVASDQITFATAPGAGTDCWILLYSEFGGVAGATTNLTIGNSLTVQGDTDLDGDIDIDAGQITYTASSNIAKFADDAKLIFGEGDDLQIYHDGSNSYIDDAGTGNLIIGAANFQLMNVAHSENHITATDNAQVELFHNGTKKFETTSTGATITGTALATALSTGASGTGINISTDTISGPATLTLDPAGVGDNTGTVIIAGGLQVDGTTTTINSTTLTVDDKNIVLASGAANAAAADGAGITVDGAAATLLYNATPDAWSFNKDVGIGTDSPGANLQITSDAPGILFQDANSGPTESKIEGLSGHLYYTTDNVNRDHIFAATGGSESLRITGDGIVRIPDNGKFTAGAGDDLQIYHAGPHTHIREIGTGALKIEGANINIDNADGSKRYIDCNDGGSVELFFNNSKKFETKSDGVDITGELQCDSLDVDGTVSVSGFTTLASLTHTGQYNIGTFQTSDGVNMGDTGYFQLRSDSRSGTSQAISVYQNGTTGTALKAAIYHNGSAKFNGILSGADATYDLGSATNRWANIYSADLQLSNEGSSNDIDGTWGAYTIQEGEEELFLINRRSGKKFKFVLEEVK